MSLLNDVLDMSKIESGKLAVHHEEFDLPKLIDSIVSIMYPQTESQGQHFSVALSGIEEERLVGDPLRINQILLNLLSNARKFTPEGGSIKLEISQKRKNGGVLMRFTVSDTGIGLSEAFQKRLFKPFEQADSSISQKYGGTGLGLAITHNLVTLMNGTIGVRSKEHEGSCFTVELPLALPPNGHIQKKEHWGWLLFSGNGGPQATVSNLWDQGGFLPHGFTGLVMMMAIIMFSFGGLELVGITAAEADNPEQSIPKATNQVIYRILIFYVGSLAVLLSLMPWTRVTADTSPFVLIFHELGDTFVANALNIVVLTAALSVYNSCVYCNSRMLFGLAQQGNAPKALMNVDKRGVPVNTILVSALVTALCVLINYLAPESAFGLLMALVVATLLLNWIMICLAHLRFRAAMRRQTRVLFTFQIRTDF